MTPEDKLRFFPQSRGNDCLNCAHHLFLAQGGVLCNNPQRPQRPVEVIRWAAGCPQHTKIKES